MGQLFPGTLGTFAQPMISATRVREIGRNYVGVLQAPNSNNWTTVNAYGTYNDNNILSTVQQESRSEMLFVWHNYH